MKIKISLFSMTLDFIPLRESMLDVSLHGSCSMQCFIVSFIFQSMIKNYWWTSYIMFMLESLDHIIILQRVVAWWIVTRPNIVTEVDFWFLKFYNAQIDLKIIFCTNWTSDAKFDVVLATMKPDSYNLGWFLCCNPRNPRSCTCTYMKEICNRYGAWQNGVALRIWTQ